MVEVANRMSERETDEEEVLDRIGTHRSLTCPECHGALWEVADGNLSNFRCHVGHAFSPSTLLTSLSRNLEASLWAAIRGFEENAIIAERIAGRLVPGGEAVRERFIARARTARGHAQELRQLIDRLPVSVE
jgi:two-component system, chemotaxis family, protein-glutamate methylesterase/glutaminase